MKLKYLCSILPLVLAASTLPAALIYSIDINDNNSGSPSPTASGWTGLNGQHTGNGGSVEVAGITFSLGSADGSRVRNSGGDLLSDFAFDDGAGQAIILFFGGAGDLEAGDWQVEVYSYDADHTIGNQFVGYRTNEGSEVIISSTVVENSTGPAATFTFTSDGSSAYDVFLRENNGSNNTRLNAVRLTLIPEPASLSLLGLGALALLLVRRKQA